jgi:hypothetical protein
MGKHRENPTSTRPPAGPVPRNTRDPTFVSGKKKWTYFRRNKHRPGRPRQPVRPTPGTRPLFPRKSTTSQPAKQTSTLPPAGPRLSNPGDPTFASGKKEWTYFRRNKHRPGRPRQPVRPTPGTRPLFPRKRPHRSLRNKDRPCHPPAHAYPTPATRPLFPGKSTTSQPAKQTSTPLPAGQRLPTTGDPTFVSEKKHHIAACETNIDPATRRPTPIQPRRPDLCFREKQVEKQPMEQGSRR